MILGIFVIVWFGVTGVVATRLSDDVKYEQKQAKDQRELFKHIDKLSTDKHGLSVHEVYNGADMHGPEEDPNGYLPQYKLR